MPIIFRCNVFKLLCLIPLISCAITNRSAGCDCCCCLCRHCVVSTRFSISLSTSIKPGTKPDSDGLELLHRFEHVPGTRLQSHLMESLSLSLNSFSIKEKPGREIVFDNLISEHAIVYITTKST